MKEHLKSLREDLWNQCDHMKFINALDSKFAVIEQKFHKFLYQENFITDEKNSNAVKINEEQSIQNTALDDRISGNTSIIENEQMRGENSMNEQKVISEIKDDENLVYSNVEPNGIWKILLRRHREGAGCLAGLCKSPLLQR